MSGVNKAIIVGNLGMDPVLNYSGANAVTRFSVATSMRWTDNNGNLNEDTEWHRIVCFGKRAESVAQHLQKGSKVYVEGRLKTSSYEKEGQTHWSTSIIANDIQFLSRAPQQQNNQNNHQQNSNKQNNQQNNQNNQQGPQNQFTPDNTLLNNDSPNDDDIPF